jgi:type VI protein secretion system component VasK
MLDPKPFLRVLDREAEVMKARGERMASLGVAWAIAGVAFVIAYVFAMFALQNYLAWYIGPPAAWAVVAAVTAVIGGAVLLICHDPRQKRRLQLAELQAEKAKLETEVELARIRAQIESLRRLAALPAGEKAAIVASYLLRKLQDR